jgi:hypothetical protein
VWAVEVCGHCRNEGGVVLLAVRFAQLDASDLFNRKCLIGGLERASKELVLRHWLGALARINAGAAKVQELLHAVLVRRLHNGCVSMLS